MSKVQGVYVAMLTPFDDSGAVNENELRRMVDFLAESGVSGLFPISSVGEFIHMSPDEKMRVMEIVVDQCRGRVSVLPGVGSSHPQESIRLAEKARQLGCSGVVVAPPYFFPLSQENIEAYFETISISVDIPIIIYNIPLFTQPLSRELVGRLARQDAFVGMKDSSGSMVDFIHFLDTTRNTGGGFSMMTGREETLLACLSVGAKGCMTATSGILPEIMVGIYEAWQAGDSETASRLQFSILPLIRAMFALPFPLGFKAALGARGFQMGPPKQPLADTEKRRFALMQDEIERIMASLLEQLN